MTGMITRTTAKELQARLDSIVARYREEKFIIIGKRGLSFSSLEEVENYCTRNNIEKRLIHKVN